MTPDKPLTLLITIVGSILAATLPRHRAIVPLALSLCLYPVTMLLPPDNLGLTAQRVIGVVLLMRCLFSRDIRSRFKWGAVDWMAATYFMLLLVAYLIAYPEKAIVNRFGFFLSAMVPFWCVRFLIVDRQSFYAFLRAWLWAGLPLAIHGVYFMNTGQSPYYSIMQYGILWYGEANLPSDMRMFMGRMFYRAHPPFLQCIMFGWFFALWLVPCTNLFWDKRKLLPWLVPWLFLPLGTISAIAAGPMMLAAFSVAMLAAFPLRKYWKYAAWAFGIAWVVVTALANRDFMSIIAGFGMDPQSSWFRVGLTRYVLHEGAMAGHWLTGYGEVPLDFRYHDLCIHWIGLLVGHGLMGIVGFYGLMLFVARAMWKAKSIARTLQDQYLLWTLLCAFIGSILAMMVVSLFSEMHYIYHMFLAVLANAPLLMGSAGGERQVGVLAEYGGRKVLLRYTLKEGQKLAVVAPNTPGGGGPGAQIPQPPNPPVNSSGAPPAASPGMRIPPRPRRG